MEPLPGSWDPSSRRPTRPPACQFRAPTSSGCQAVARLPRAVTLAQNDDETTASGVLALASRRSQVSGEAELACLGSTRRGCGWALQGMGRNLAPPCSPELPYTLPLRPDGCGSRGHPNVGWGWRKLSGSGSVTSSQPWYRHDPFSLGSETWA